LHIKQRLWLSDELREEPSSGDSDRGDELDGETGNRDVCVSFGAGCFDGNSMESGADDIMSYDTTFAVLRPDISMGELRAKAFICKEDDGSVLAVEDGLSFTGCFVLFFSSSVF